MSLTSRIKAQPASSTSLRERRVPQQEYICQYYEATFPLTCMLHKMIKEVGEEYQSKQSSDLVGPLPLAAALLAEGKVVDHRTEAFLIFIFHLFQLLVEVLSSLLLIGLLIVVGDCVVLWLLSERVGGDFDRLIFISILAHLTGHWSSVLHDLLPISVRSLTPPFRWVGLFELMILLNLLYRFQFPRAVN